MSVWIALSESGLRPGNAQATLSTSLHRKFVTVNGVLPDADPSRPGYLDPTLGEKGIAKSALVNAKVNGHCLPNAQFLL